MAKKSTSAFLNQVPIDSELLNNTRFVVSLDIGSQKITGAILRPDRSLVLKPAEFDNQIIGYEWLEKQLNKLEVPVEQILIGMEATGRYWETCYYYFERKGYHLILLHPHQTHQWAERRSLRAKTDKLDTITIGRLLLSGEAKAGYVPSELIVAYRELVRLHASLSVEISRYRNEIHALQVVLFPEFTSLFADVCGSTALPLLKKYPSAHCFVEAGVEAVAVTLSELAPRHFGLETAQTLVDLARKSGASGVARQARSKGLVILCEQLMTTQKHLAELEEELAKFLDSDEDAKGLASVKEFGPKTKAVLRAELGDVQRFARVDQAVAYVGLDLQVKQSGKWKGKTKLSKRGSGLVRQMLYMTALSCLRRHNKASAFRGYYDALVERGLKGREALVALMRKLLAVAFSLLKNGGVYDPAKVWVGNPVPAAKSA
jgi:transposase